MLTKLHEKSEIYKVAVVVFIALVGEAAADGPVVAIRRVGPAVQLT